MLRASLLLTILLAQSMCCVEYPSSCIKSTFLSYNKLRFLMCSFMYWFFYGKKFQGEHSLCTWIFHEISQFTGHIISKLICTSLYFTSCTINILLQVMAMRFSTYHEIQITRNMLRYQHFTKSHQISLIFCIFCFLAFKPIFYIEVLWN